MSEVVTPNTVEAPAMLPVRDLFNAPDVRADACVPVRPRLAAIPETCYVKINKHYLFDSTLLKKMMRYFIGAPARRNLLLMGDAGVGKSSLAEQMAARLGWPVWSIACSGRMRLAHFVGSMELVNGETRWRNGPLIMAMKYGGLFLADEITRLDHSEQMALAKALDADGSITIPETGEVVVPHPQFRFIATGNSGGYGDESGAYNGERVSSVAFLDRFQKITLDYLPPEKELAVLQSVTEGKLGDPMLQGMVQLANNVRKQFVSRGGELRTVFSTRSLVIWALETIGYKEAKIGAAYSEDALNDTILNGSPTHDVEVVSELWNNWIQTS